MWENEFALKNYQITNSLAWMALTAPWMLWGFMTALYVPYAIPMIAVKMEMKSGQSLFNLSVRLLDAFITFFIPFVAVGVSIVSVCLFIVQGGFYS